MARVPSLRLFGEQVLLVPRGDVVDLAGPQASALVESLMASERGRELLRDLLDVPRSEGDDALRQQAIQRLPDAGLALVRIERPRRLDPPQSVWLSDLGTAEPEAPTPLVPPPASRVETTFVAFRLVGTDGTPIPRQPFSLTTPDGRTIDGETDDSGSFMLEPVHASGSCSVRFHDLTGET